VGEGNHGPIDPHRRYCVGVRRRTFAVLNIVTQLAWKTPYSLRDNNISDLGNRYCRYTGSDNPPRRYICSPLHTTFDIAMIVTGLLIVVGALLTASLWPADVNLNRHVLGAFLLMGAGNVGLLLAGFAAKPPLRAIALVLSIAALAASVLHFGKHYLGLGMGGSERIAVFVLPLWVLRAGVHIAVRQRERPFDT
jgi:hypothetical membrane protein